jgi:hypothetical protein
VNYWDFPTKLRNGYRSRYGRYCSLPDKKRRYLDAGTVVIQARAELDAPNHSIWIGVGVSLVESRLKHSGVMAASSQTSGLANKSVATKPVAPPPQIFPRVRMEGAESPINEKPRLNIETAPGECADHCGASPQSLSMHEKFIEGIQGVIFSRCAGRITHMKLSL